MTDRILAVVSLVFSFFTFITCMGSMLYVENKVNVLKPDVPETKPDKQVFFEEDGTVFKPRI